MKIHNFRAGFATNSSSSHSVILISPDKVGAVSPIREGDDEFGWDWFRLTSPEAKLRYLAAQFFSNKAVVDNEDLRRLIVAKIDEHVPHYADMIRRNYKDMEGEERSYTHGGKTETYISRETPYVDHQSVYRFANPSEKMVDQLIGFFKSPQVVVLGGNDNEDSDSNVVPGSTELSAFTKAMTDGDGSLRVRSEGDYWSMFNEKTGTKVRMSLNPNQPDYVKSVAPELVDLKITDYCGRGCNFCYQSSTEAGQHGDFDKIVGYLDMLSAMEVFEVAIGGGEPTDHPQFVEILEAAAARNVKPNFTTLSGRWLKDERVVAAVKKHVGGIGVSCSDKKALALVEEINTALGGKHRRWTDEGGPTVSAQHVLGAVPIAVTGELLEAAFDDHTPVLLLGYKEVGFGKQFQRFDDPATTEVALKLCLDASKKRWCELSVDTALVDTYPQIMSILGIPDALVTSREGAFSCYIDAVEGLMGPSSYIEKSDMTPVATDVDAFKAVYAGY